VLQCVGNILQPCSLLATYCSPQTRFIGTSISTPYNVLNSQISILKEPAVCCRVLQCVGNIRANAVHCNILQHTMPKTKRMPYVAVCCSVLQCVGNIRANTAHCNTLQHTTTHCTTLHYTAPHCTTLRRFAASYLKHSQKSEFSIVCVCSSALQCIAVQYSVLQRGAA